MTPYQEEVFRALKRGEKLSFEISGIYFRHKKLRVETADAIIDTGELARLVVDGRMLRCDYLVHRSQLEHVREQLVKRGYKVVSEQSTFRI